MAGAVVDPTASFRSRRRRAIASLPSIVRRQPTALIGHGLGRLTKECGPCGVALAWTCPGDPGNPSRDMGGDRALADLRRLTEMICQPAPAPAGRHISFLGGNMRSRLLIAGGAVALGFGLALTAVSVTAPMAAASPPPGTASSL